MRWVFVVAVIFNWGPRFGHVAELYSNQNMVMVQGVLPLSRWLIFTPTTAVMVYACIWLGLIPLIWGRFVRSGAALTLVAISLLLMAESSNIKAYDRLLWLHCLALALSPVLKKDLPGARYFVFLYTMGLYGLTGWSKLLDEPSWWLGTPLKSQLIHLEFGLLPVGVWVSRQDWLLPLLGTTTLLFEAGFPILVLFRRIRPKLLFIGVCFHLGTLLMMDVGAFWIASLVSYPVLLHPDDIHRFQEWLKIKPWGRRIADWADRSLIEKKSLDGPGS
jgi:hypothetical protein